MLLSGAFTGPLIVGNLKNDTGAKAGMWGMGGPVPGVSGAQLTMSHMASTVAQIIGVPSPLSAAGTVAVLNNGVLTPVIERTRITS